MGYPPSIFFIQQQSVTPMIDRLMKLTIPGKVTVKDKQAGRTVTPPRLIA